MRYIVREYKSIDKKSIFDLWKKAYSADEINKRKAQFTRVADENPTANQKNYSTYHVIEYGDKIIGYIGKMPVKFYVQGKLLDGYFLHDGLVDPSYRGKGLGQILMRDVEEKANSFVIASWMNTAQYNLTKKCGWLDIPGFHSYKKIIFIDKYIKIRNFKLRNSIQMLYSLLSRGLEKTVNSFEQALYKIEERDSFETEVNKFSLRISKDYGIIVYRNASYLNWKFSKLPGKQFKKLLAYRNNELAGYVVLNTQRLRNGKVCGTIVDILTKKNDTASFVKLVTQSIKVFRMYKVDYVVCYIVPLKFRKILKRLGFIRSKKQSPVMVTNWEHIFKKDYISNINNLYLTDGDNDREFWQYNE